MVTEANHCILASPSTDTSGGGVSGFPVSSQREFTVKTQDYGKFSYIIMRPEFDGSATNWQLARFEILNTETNVGAQACRAAAPPMEAHWTLNDSGFSGWWHHTHTLTRTLSNHRTPSFSRRMHTGAHPVCLQQLPGQQQRLRLHLAPVHLQRQGLCAHGRGQRSL